MQIITISLHPVTQTNPALLKFDQQTIGKQENVKSHNVFFGASKERVLVTAKCIRASKKGIEFIM
jgi:hypothetical protein